VHRFAGNQPLSTPSILINLKKIAMKSFQLFASLMLCLFCFAKSAESQNWAVGAHFGENLSTLRGYSKTDYLPGFMAGVHVSHYLTENMVVRLEVDLDRKGTRFDNGNQIPDPGAPDLVDDYRFDYLALPLMLRYSTKTPVKFVVGGGVSVDYLIRQRTNYGSIVSNEIGQYRRLDADLLSSIGCSVTFLKKMSFSLEMRGIWGIVKVDKPRGVANDNEFGRNLTWGLMAGVNYYL
jgi:Outer membrane protein beta-barrel domain